MIGWLRIVLALTIFVFGTIFCAGLHAFARLTGWIGEDRMPRLWHKMILRLLAMKVYVTGKLAEERPLLIASNHISWSDIMVIGSVADVHFIARGDMARWPVLGRLAKLQRTIFVERQARRRSGEQAGEIAERLKAGEMLVLFAEGTTGDGNTVLPFKTTLFAAAGLAAGEGEGRPITVQPVAVAYVRSHGVPLGRLERTRYAWIGDQSLLPHLLMLLRGGAVDVELSFGEPLRLDREGGRKALARAAEASVRTMMARSLSGPVASI
jgi:1-acyl-sn-glycerol-3-phosphate acyltransferase